MSVEDHVNTAPDGEDEEALKVIRRRPEDDQMLKNIVRSNSGGSIRKRACQTETPLDESEGLQERVVPFRQRMPENSEIRSLSPPRLNSTDIEVSSTTNTSSTNIFVDDPSLLYASSAIRFHNTDTISRVFVIPDAQFIIEEGPDDKGNRRITTKYNKTGTAPLKALRAAYTLMTVFFAGFLFVFCLQLLLYIVLELTVHLGPNSNHRGWGICVLLSLPIFLHGLAESLVIAIQYIKDTWDGHPLVKQFVFGRRLTLLADWVIVLTFLAIPIMIAVITLFIGVDNWWEVTSLAWFACITIFYIIFAATITYFENKACWEVHRNKFRNVDNSWSDIIARAVRMRQRSIYSGTKRISYLARGQIDHTFGFETNEKHGNHIIQVSSSFYSKIVALEFWESLGLFEAIPVEERKRVYTLANVKKERTFVTSDTWSLDTIYCRPKDAQYVAVLRGPKALKRFQIRSSLACHIMANLTIILLTASFLTWLEIPVYGTFIVVLLVTVFGLGPGIISSYSLFHVTKDLLLVTDGGDETDRTDEERPLEDAMCHLNSNESEGLLQVSETYRVTKVTALMCWILLVSEIIIFFYLPLRALYEIGFSIHATLFLFIGIVSGLRSILSAATVLEEFGDITLVDGEKGSTEHWQNQSRLSTIVTDVSRSRLRGYIVGILLIFLITILGLLGIAVTQTADTTSDFQFTYLPDFEYIPHDDLTYPTCSFGKSLSTLYKTDMSDYAYLSTLAYRDPNITQVELDQWFGKNVAYDNQTFVDTYRTNLSTTTKVSYKLITFPNSDNSNSAVISIRGTTNAFDALTDAQLWSGAMIFQVVRAILPLGEVFTPILHRIINVVSWLSSQSIEKISFYDETTKFAKYLLSLNEFNSIEVTGHSLGGGLSIITGAQANISAIALSGPNALLSRESFSPPITEESLNTKTFNIIPDRDIVPRFDDVAKLSQNIRCTADKNRPIDCHDGRRSLCEILYTCGTRFRPALCECVTIFGYPEPKPKNGTNKTFAEECANAKME